VTFGGADPNFIQNNSSNPAPPADSFVSTGYSSGGVLRLHECTAVFLIQIG
jgi:hypothetical protein